LNQYLQVESCIKSNTVAKNKKMGLPILRVQLIADRRLVGNTPCGGHLAPQPNPKTISLSTSVGADQTGQGGSAGFDDPHRELSS
jgi:hypothetical protein